MLPPMGRRCCQNCEHLRIDNFCLVKGKYILSRNISKDRDCNYFSSLHLEDIHLYQKNERQEIIKKILDINKER